MPKSIERYRHDALRRRPHDDLADLGRAGEESLAMAGWLAKRAAAFLAVASEHVEHAGRQNSWQISAISKTPRRVLGRLRDHDIAGAQGRARS